MTGLRASRRATMALCVALLLAAGANPNVRGSGGDGEAGEHIARDLRPLADEIRSVDEVARSLVLLPAGEREACRLERIAQ